MSENCPIGSDYRSDAPWNEVEYGTREIDVTVSITLSKTFTIGVDDYKVISMGLDEDGNPDEDIDYSDCNVESEVVNQHWMPDQILNEIAKGNLNVETKAIKEDCKGWNIDEFEVIQE